MKVNERCLIHIAQSNDNPTDQYGWLQIWNEEKKHFQKRWFILKENLLFYFNQKTDKEPLGVIILDGYRVEIIESIMEHGRFAFKIDFGLSRFGHELKSYILAADSHSEMESWIKALSCASYDYLKMVVSELQHRLDEINSFNNEKAESNDNKGSSSSNITLISSSSDQSTSTSSTTSRFNPFDECEDSKTITFIDLHEKYGLEIRKHFQ